MDRTPVTRAVRRLAVLAFVAATLVPLGRQISATATAPDQVDGQQPPPLVLAQGRCFNGRCF